MQSLYSDIIHVKTVGNSTSLVQHSADVNVVWGSECRDVPVLPGAEVLMSVCMYLCFCLSNSLCVCGCMLGVC